MTGDSTRFSRSAGRLAALAGNGRAFAAGVGVLALAAAVAVGSTWRVFSQVVDEPAHIAAGMEWIAQGEYTYEPQHPPLARVLFAAGPALRGVPYVEQGWLVEQGNAILYHGDRYSSILAAARAGNLPFLLIAIVAVALWTRRLFGEGAALLAVLLTITLPPILAHAGLATTDFPVTAAIVAALAAFDAWLDRPSPARSALLGALLALAIMTKFSAVAFLPVGLLAVAIFSRLAGNGRAPLRARAAGALVAAASAIVLVWAAYRFSVGPVTIFPAADPGIAHAMLARLDGVRFPAPELFAGFDQLLRHEARGHASYLLGKVSFEGWWYYFPVALLVKTPIPFLLLAGAGPVVLPRARSLRAIAPAAAALAMLAVATTTSINIGVRHILPLFPLLAVSAGGAAAALLKARRTGALAVALLVAWQVVGTIAAHPDHLAWFNEIAREKPDAWLADSNLDWGQDLLRLSRETRKRNVPSLRLAYFGSAIPERHKLPPLLPVRGDQPSTGWIAVSRMVKLGIPYQRPSFLWLDAHEPIEVGESILLYHVPEDHGAPAAVAQRSAAVPAADGTASPGTP